MSFINSLFGGPTAAQPAPSSNVNILDPLTGKVSVLGMGQSVDLSTASLDETIDRINAMQQSQAGLVNNTSIYPGQGVSGALGGLHSPAHNIFAKPQPPDPNTQPEMQMPLEDLYLLWQARYSDEWVQMERLQDAGGMTFNWYRAAERLRAMYLVEQDSSRGYYKLAPHIQWK